MPYKIQWGTHGVAVELEGEISASEIYSSNYAIYNSPEFDRMRYQLVDTLKVTNITLSEKDLEILASLDKSSSASHRFTRQRVLVAMVTDNIIIREMSVKYGENLTGSLWECEVFEKKEGAIAWIKEQLNMDLLELDDQ